MASATFRMGTGSTSTGPWVYGSYGACIDATIGQYIKVDLQSTSGVNAVEVAITSADENWIASLPAVTVDQATKTAVFRVPTTVTLIEGATFLVRVRINGGVDTSDATTAAYESRLLVHVLTASGSRVLAVGETTEYSTSAGHVAKLNALIRNAPPQTAHFSKTGIATTVGAVNADLVALDYLSPDADNGAVTAVARIVGITSPVTGAAGFVVSATAYYTSVGGWVLASGSPDVMAAATDFVGTSATFIGGGGSQLILRVTGVAATTIYWSATVDYAVKY